MLKLVPFMAMLAFAGAASAQTVGTLKTPAPANSPDLTAGGVLWACAGATCTAMTDTSTLDDLDMCRGLTRQMGEVTQFAKLNPSTLARCNSVARKI